jgi:sigma-B regulation protein RsbU (phosphoserine phosphatase)
MNTKETIHRDPESPEEALRHYAALESEAETVREMDKVLIRGLFGNFYGRRLNVGIGFQRAVGSILSGDYFELIKLPDGNYLFIFADISGHGLPAYTTLIRFRAAVALAVKDAGKSFRDNGHGRTGLVRDIIEKFTDVMESSVSNDFASVIFTFIRNEGDRYHLNFFNRGMYFPLVVRKFNNEPMNLYDLNESEKGWIPMKGGLLGYEFRKILGDRYYASPSCEFVLYEGDNILFFSDGIVEANRGRASGEDFGLERIKRILNENINLFPQAVINMIFEEVYEFMGDSRNQHDDMTAVLIDFPLVR